MLDHSNDKITFWNVFSNTTCMYWNSISDRRLKSQAIYWESPRWDYKGWKKNAFCTLINGTENCIDLYHYKDDGNKSLKIVSFI